MFFAGWNPQDATGWQSPGVARAMMLFGRIILGTGVGAFDAIIPVYSSELMDSGTRGRALAQEFQANIFGLNMAFIINVAVTRALSKSNQWAWRIPIIVMQIYPVILLTFLSRLPESPRWLLFAEKDDRAKDALGRIYSDEDAKSQFEKLEKSREEEQSQPVSYTEMLIPGGSQYHPTYVHRGRTIRNR